MDGASPLSLRACCPLAVYTSPPTHLMPGLWVVLVISAGGLAGVVAGVGSRTLLADVVCLGEGWGLVLKVIGVLGVVRGMGVLLAGVGMGWRQEV